MKLAEEYRLSTYRDYGPLQSKDHVRLVRNELNGRIYIKKIVNAGNKPVFDFLREHPQKYIPKIEECIVDGERLIVIEEYVEGISLETFLSENDLSEKECAMLTVRLCQAIQPLHEADPPVICRDLKAENIVITSDKMPKIVDFDIARVYQSGKNRDTTLMGTAEYAAPEQFGYFQTDNRTDIYALGVLLNYMLTGNFPVERIAPGRLEPIIRKCISMNPQDRYQSVQELKKDLEQTEGITLDSQPVKEMPIEKEYEAAKKEKSKKQLAPPGFRTRTPWKMCAAIVGYIFIADVCYEVQFTIRDASLVPDWLLRIEQTVLLISQIAEVFLIFNYRGWRDGRLFLGNKSAGAQIFGCAVMEILFFLTAFFLCMFLETTILG